jgi:hypothetical protein
MGFISVDPGNKESAFTTWLDGMPNRSQKVPNDQLLAILRNCPLPHMAIEMVACYGMAVGAEVFDTCVWIGRFIERWEKPYTLIYRKDVKLFLCGSLNAKDKNIRQRIIDIYGGKELAIGNKKNPGVLYGVSGDCWSSIAVGLTHRGDPWTPRKFVPAVLPA